MSVLVVDDHQDNRDLLCLFLRHKGICTLEAANGLEAVDIARTDHPNLIFMDISMPVLDGIAATKVLRTLQQTCDIPIVALSAHCSDSDMRQKAVEAGCTSCLCKPLEFDLLETILHDVEEFQHRN
ncbi:response regulator [bacterium]|nr:MAG: response regulator [bacterium]